MIESQQAVQFYPYKVVLLHAVGALGHNRLLDSVAACNYWKNLLTFAK